MRGNAISGWLYQGHASKDRPADLGSFMGERIAPCRWPFSDLAAIVRQHPGTSVLLMSSQERSEQALLNCGPSPTQGCQLRLARF